MKKPTILSLTILLITALLLCASCTFGGIYRPISESELDELNVKIDNLELPHQYELKYELKSVDPEQTDGIESATVKYMYKIVEAEDGNSHTYDEYYEVDLTADGNKYHMEYYYISTTDKDNRTKYILYSENGTTVKGAQSVYDDYVPEFVVREFNTYQGYFMCQNLYNMIWREANSIHLAVEDFFSYGRINCISKSGNSVKCQSPATDTIDEYYLNWSGDYITAMKERHVGSDGTITCTVKSTNKNVTLPGWTKNVSIETE
ncbi:MAG: hypothetical protein J1F68_02405 [Clostridiales bacterium]|nr:hypothetical protein [Clostridiales bacterium]